MTKMMFHRQNYKVARSYECHYDIRIDDDKDLEHVKMDMKHIERVDNLHISLRNNIMTKEHFLELFSTLSNTNQKHLHLDLTNTDIDDDKIEAIINCFKTWKLNNLQLHVSRIKFTDSQFEKLMNSIQNMTTLDTLTLEMEDVNMNEKKRNIIEDTLYSMNNLKRVQMNLRNNEISENEGISIRKMLDKFEMSHFFF